MATIKSYTDIEQSKKLAEILPLESADMNYTLEDFVDEDTGDVYSIEHAGLGCPSNDEIGCWSLAALLGVLTKNKICHYDDRYYCQYISECDEFCIYSTAAYDNPIDVCYEMILNLHELNLL